MPNGAAGLELLAQICEKTNRTPEAQALYRQSLALNPLGWSAFARLAELGGDEDCAQIFGVDDEEAATRVRTASEAVPARSSGRADEDMHTSAPTAAMTPNPRYRAACRAAAWPQQTSVHGSI